ncbi:ATP-dependent RNA helicase TDRD9-like [Octopus vulgaris]|uniref:RNA helicase n=1 Tax=Octopus vulgaris TaxID=6645 RepID=A0AA36BQF5_OCTVU|nr:ATP-dependent RNA helicase TDRD9-like [Octopus vulgaris]
MAVNTNFLTPDLTLDHYDDWLKGNLSKSKTQIKTVVKSKTCGKALDRKSLTPVESPPSMVPPHQSYSAEERTNYVLEYQAAEQQRLTEQSQMCGDVNVSANEASLNQLEEDSGLAEISSNIKENLRLNTDVYEGFTFSHSSTVLPIEEHKSQIINTVESNQVTVIQGPTGSGKTTQVPQFILDHYASKNQYCNIVVTQPRRIAAISIAKRICQERRWKLGTFCGYQVGMDREVSPNTRLTYMTTGVLLQKLINKKDVNDYTHVILDEIHERDQETDFCILIVRKFLRSVSRGIRVILMSATLDSEMFANYFALPVRNTLDPAPIITIDGSFFSVSEYYVEDLVPLGTISQLDPDNPHITTESQQLAVNLIQHFDTFENKEQGNDPHSGQQPICGSVLVFLPGLADIDKLYDKLRTLPGQHRLVVIPLHSSVTIEEQSKVFQPTSPGYRKVILSTNIAESSITVPDIKYVIDFCLTKNLMCDTQTNFTSLQMDWASKANCIQRKGRAGRVSNGRVYRLITRSFWHNHIPDYNTPEMQRCPLDLLVLRTKILDLGEPKAILALALAPPNLDDIERTILELKEIGALALTLNGVPNRYDADLTYMGRVIASLPTDIRIGKLLVWGHVFGFLKECLILAAALSLKSVISRPYKKHLESYQRKFSWADASFSDCIAIVNIFKVWERNWAHGIFKRRGQSEVEWGKANFVQIKRMHELAELIRELEFRLTQFNLRIPSKSPESKKDLNHPEEKLLFKLIICGAFYPNYFTRDKIDEEQVMKTMSGKDPFNTVMINGLPSNQGSLYKSQIEQLFYPCGNILAIHMEESKIFIEFARHYGMNRALNNVIGMGNTGVVNPAVYLALKMKKTSYRTLELEQYSRETATKLMKQVSQVQSNIAGKLQTLRTNRITAASATVGKQVDLPNYSMSVIEIIVTEVLECGHFWARYVDQENSLYFVQSSLNINPQDLQPISGNVHVGMICAAPYKDEEVHYYRAQVEAIHNNMAHVFFVDYGNMEIAPFHNLKLLPQSLLNIPFQAFECYLSEIQPSPIKCFDGCWSQESTDYFQNMVSGFPIYAQIYSVVGRVLHVELIKKKSKQQENINRKLIDLGYADVTEESFLSKKDHEERKRAQESSSLSICQNSDSASLDWNTLGLANEFGSARCVGKIKLHGPSNPLEMSFSGMTNSGRLRGAKIDSDSVNCVAIDDNPQNSSARMMVAAFVHMNANGVNVITRDTTLMPHIAGLPALVAMLFTPYCELRTDKNMTYYTGAICGLGFDSETGTAVYPEHDMEIEFDSKIDLDDIFKINGIRLAINIIIGNQQTASTWGPESVVKLQESARRKLLDLMQKRREPIDPVPSWSPYEWNLISPSDYLKPDCSDNNWELLFKLHKGVALAAECSSSLNDDEEDNSISERDISELENHIQELKVIARMSSYSNAIRCKLCKETFPSPKLLSMHISTQGHLRKEASILGGAI